MAKTVVYPTSEWLEKYINKHDCSLEDAECAWWDAQIDKGNPTPFDLDAEHEKAVKEVTKGMAKSTHVVEDAFGKKHKKERKPNADKREIIETIAQNLTRVCGEDLTKVENIVVSNVERQVDFTYNGVEYSVTLTAHRKPKEGK